MKLYTAFLGLALLSPAQSFATPLPKDVFYDLEAAVQRGDKETVSYYVTEASQPWVNRFFGHNLQGCIPANASYMGERRMSGVMYIKVGVEEKNTRYFTELAFTREHGQWKLDLPESFRSAWDDNWEQRLNQAETLYLALKSQMGDQLNCDMVQGLVNG